MSWCCSRLGHIVPRCHSPDPNLLQHQDTIPHAVNLSLTLLKMRKKLPEHVELTLEINKLLLLHLVGFFYIILPTLMMHGQTQIKVLWCLFTYSDSLPFFIFFLPLTLSTFFHSFIRPFSLRYFLPFSNPFPTLSSSILSHPSFFLTIHSFFPSFLVIFCTFLPSVSYFLFLPPSILLVSSCFMYLFAYLFAILLATTKYFCMFTDKALAQCSRN